MKNQTCESCGAPLELAPWTKGKDIERLCHLYCVQCKDEEGKLKPFEEIRSRFADWIMEQAKTKDGAEFLAGWLLSYQPAWRSRNE